MKKLIVLPLALVLTTTFGQTKNEQNAKSKVKVSGNEIKPFVKHAAASVNKDGGLYIFTDCKPQVSYVILGSLEYGLSSSYSAIKKNFITEAKQKYHQADGLILFLNADGPNRADVIKFR